MNNPITFVDPDGFYPRYIRWVIHGTWSWKLVFYAKANKNSRTGKYTSCTNVSIDFEGFHPHKSKKNKSKPKCTIINNGKGVKLSWNVALYTRVPYFKTRLSTRRFMATKYFWVLKG